MRFGTLGGWIWTWTFLIWNLIHVHTPNHLETWQCVCVWDEKVVSFHMFVSFTPLMKKHVSGMTPTTILLLWRCQRRLNSSWTSTRLSKNSMRPMLWAFRLTPSFWVPSLSLFSPRPPKRLILVSNPFLFPTSSLSTSTSSLTLSPLVQSGFKSMSLFLFLTLQLSCIKSAYSDLVQVTPKIMLMTYFGHVDSNITFVSKLLVAGLHIDLDCAPAQIDNVVCKAYQHCPLPWHCVWP